MNKSASSDTTRSKDRSTSNRGKQGHANVADELDNKLEGFFSFRTHGDEFLKLSA